MGTTLDILIFVSFIIEVVILLYMENKCWKTLYTPLNFLMLPYVLVLIITVCIAGRFDFVSFYYPSILFWSFGLLLFAIPSFTLGFLMNKSDKPLNSLISTNESPKIVYYISLLICFVFVVRFFQMSASSKDFIGSEDFGMTYCGSGFWGHLRQLSLPLLIMTIYYANRKDVSSWIIIVVLLLVNFLYQVKGWVIIPCIAGLSMRLYTKKSEFRLSLILWIIFGAICVFFISYWLMPILAGGTAGWEIVGFIFGHFFHYLSSGVLGLSVDMQQNFPDVGNFEIIWAPFINLFNFTIGDGEIISPVNSFYYNTGLNWTNVRTFFGTLYIYSNWIEFTLYTLLLSSIMYMLKICSTRCSNIYIYVIYFFECALLCFGWFEFYFFHLTTIELPMMTLLILLIDYLIRPKVINQEQQKATLL